MKAAIYCRLSKEDADHGKESESIQNQRAMLVNYARENGLELYQIYCDEDYSGADRERPAFNRMIEDARHRRFEVILAKTQARFTRDMELVERYLHGKFAEWGIRFIAVVDHTDTADAASKKSRQINGLVNEWYLEDLSCNIRSVFDHKRRAGKYIATYPLYGYRKDPDDHNHLLIDPEAAAVVKRIFSLYLSGLGPARITRLLNQEGLPSPSQYRRSCGVNFRKAAKNQNEDLWSAATVNQMLRNRTYAGDLVQGRHKKLSYKSKKTVWLPKEEWIVVPNTHEAIIAPEAFDRVQSMLAANGQSNKNGRVHPLAHKVVCGLCGSRMGQSGGAKNGTGARYFRCRTAARDRSRCPGQPYIPAAALFQLVLQRIQAHVAAGFLPPPVCLPADSPLALRQKARAEERRKVQAEIDRRCNARQALYLDQASGLISPSLFSQLDRAYAQEIAQYEKRLAQLDRENDTAKDPDKAQEEFRTRLQSLAQARELTRELSCLLVDTVTVFPPDLQTGTRRIEIRWNF